jgi:hypothetical protein
MTTTGDGFRRSSFCSGGTCLEVRHADGRVAVRDAKDPHHPEQRFTARAWAAFLAGVRAGEFDRR